jgi:hypothetical protein
MGHRNPGPLLTGLFLSATLVLVGVVNLPKATSDTRTGSSVALVVLGALSAVLLVVFVIAWLRRSSND